MKSLPTYPECLELLLRHKTPHNVIDHLIYTTQTAIQVSNNLKQSHITNLNCDLVLAGAMLHDIGRSQSHGIDHGILGAKLLRSYNFPESLIHIVQNHLFAGITRNEAVELRLPAQDFIPTTWEEKIVAYADNVSKGPIRLSTEKIIIRYTKYLPPTHSIILRVWKLHNEINNLLTLE